MLQFVNRPAFLAEAQRGSPIAIGRTVVMEPTDLNDEVAGFTVVVGGHINEHAQRCAAKNSRIETWTQSGRSVRQMSVSSFLPLADKAFKTLGANWLKVNKIQQSFHVSFADSDGHILHDRTLLLNGAPPMFHD
jgi:hypothetical protein